MGDESVVRPAETGDLDLLEKIENSADIVLIDLNSACQRLTQSPERQWASLSSSRPPQGEEVVGFNHHLEAGDIAHLEQLSVTPAHARRGLGRALVEAAMTEATRRGY